jgi:hypothetical protein
VQESLLNTPGQDQLELQTLAGQFESESIRRCDRQSGWGCLVLTLLSASGVVVQLVRGTWAGVVIWLARTAGTIGAMLAMKIVPGSRHPGERQRADPEPAHQPCGRALRAPTGDAR